MKKKVSVYLKSGERAAVTYYRFSQFFRAIDADFNYHLMIPERHQAHYLPIAKQPFLKKVYIFVYIFVRVFCQLIQDNHSNCDYLIVSRRFLNKIFPIPFYYLLYRMKKKGTKIIWDFDDQIIKLGEVSRKGFDKLSSLADTIIVGSPVLKDLINEPYQSKIVFLPTTDGDMSKLLTEEKMQEREETLNSIVKVVWVGTFSGLLHLSQITPAFEMFGKELQKNGRKLKVSVVCDYPLEYKAECFELENISWERKLAAEKMLGAHIGVMPLEDNEIARGKCGFKLIQYLSVGLPVVGSSVGMNKQIISSNVGLAVDTLAPDSWYDAFLMICSSPTVWRSYSIEAQKKWSKEFSYESNLNMWKKLLI